MENGKSSYNDLALKIEELEKKAELFQLIADNTYDWELFTDGNGKVLYCNPAFERITGYSPQDLLAGVVTEKNLVHPGDLEAVYDIILQTKQQISISDFEFRLVRSDGELRILNLCSQPVYQETEFVGTRSSIRDISESKTLANLNRTREKAAAHGILHRSILQTAMDGYWLADLKGNLREVNEAYARMSGYTVDELLAMKISDLEVYESLDVVKEHIEKIISFGADRFETKHRRTDGTIFDLEVCAQFKAVYGGLVVVFLRDISQMKMAEQKILKAKEAAEESERKLKDQKEVIELNNERLESLFKISQFQSDTLQELLDFALHEAISLTNSKVGYIYFYNEDTRQFTLNSWSKGVMAECAVADPETIYDLDRTGCWGDAVRLRKPIIINDYPAGGPSQKGVPEGHVKLLKFLTIPVFSQNKIVAVTGVANKPTDYDQSDIRQLSLLLDNVWRISERMALIDKLRLAKEKAEESDRLKTAFLQNMSHEVRTPLNAIIGFSKMLDKPELSPDKRKNFTSIVINSSNQLLSIVNDVLTISSLETKQETVNLQNVCINTIVLDLFSIFKVQSLNKNISIYVQHELTDKESQIFTDKTKVNQILTNLLSNALKFTHEGYVEFGYKMKHPEEQLEFYVKDTGIGIKAVHLDAIFERFRQADLSTSRVYGGTGLGLAISKSFVELLGGRIWVDSVVGEGSTFYFTIPYRPVFESGRASSLLKQNATSRTVLVAEDEEFNYLLIEEILIEMDIKLLHAKNGAEAVEACQRHPHITLVLMDIKMPIMDGHTAAKQIKEFKPTLPIVAQSAYALESEIEKYSGIFDDYLTKPIKVEDLKQLVMKYIEI